MKIELMRTKVLIIISILLISSFGLFVTGTGNFINKNIEIRPQTDGGSVSEDWEPPAIKTFSRATITKAGSRINNNGTDKYGYYLGNIDTTTYKSDASTLDDFFTDSDLGSPDATGKKRPIFPGSVDVVYDLTIDSIWQRDDNGTNGDEMLYQTEIKVDYSNVELRDETDWSWTTATTPFHEAPNTEPNIYATHEGDRWMKNNLTINNKLAVDFDASLYDHEFYRHRVSDVNTIANEDLTADPVYTAYVFNNTVPNEFIDVNNDGYLNSTTEDLSKANPEYRDLIRINTGPKTFGGFSLDVKPDTKPGVYRFPVTIYYRFQNWAPLPSDKFTPWNSNMSSPDYSTGIPQGNLHTSGALGAFMPYFWVPYNTSTNDIVVDISDENHGVETSTLQLLKKCSFTKRTNYYDPATGQPDYDKDDVDGKNSFEPIPDLSTNVIDADIAKQPYTQYDLNVSGVGANNGYLDWDGNNEDGDFHGKTGMDTYNYNHPDGTSWDIHNFEQNWEDNFHLDEGDNVNSRTYPVGLPMPDHDYSFIAGTANDGNGTWQSESLKWKPGVKTNNKGYSYAGYEGDFVWLSSSETYWLQLRVYSGSDLEELNNTELGLIMKIKGAADEYVTDGDKFEAFTITIANQEYDHITASTIFDFRYSDIEATLILGTANEQYFNVFAPGIAQVKELTDSLEDLEFRITSKPYTPPGYYYFTLHMEYYKIYFEQDDDDPRDNIRIDVTEDIMVQFFVEFSPDLAVNDAALKAAPAVRAISPTLTIHTGTNKTMISFDIENTGNVELIGDAQYVEYRENDYNGKLGDVGMYIAGVELLGPEYYEEDEINNYPVFEQIDPIPITKIDVGEIISVDVPVRINHNWDNPPGIYRVHLNYRGFYFDPGNVSAASPASSYVYTEIRWFPTPGSPDRCWVYRDTDGTGDITGADPKDETDGIFTDITIEEFDPSIRELGIMNFSIDGVPNGVITQGTTSAVIDIEFVNNAPFEMMNIDVMLAIGGTWFSVFSHYDIDEDGISESMLMAHIPSLPSGETYTATFEINGIDRLTPTGWHHLPINYVYDFYEFGTYMSSYGIVWDGTGARFVGYIDEDADGVWDSGTPGDDNELMAKYNYDEGYLAVEVVEDNLLDVIAEAQDMLDYGDEIRNVDIEIELSSREYVDYTQIVAFLETEADVTDPEQAPLTPVRTQILENPITRDNQPIRGVFDDPLDDTLPADDSNTLIFNVDLVDPVQGDRVTIFEPVLHHGGVFTFNLILNATNDDTNTRALYNIPVNIRVMPVEPILMIADGTVDVGDGISPGEEFDMTITLENVGKDTAREIYVTLSNDWYQDKPFQLIDAYVTATSSYNKGDNAFGDEDSRITAFNGTYASTLEQLGIFGTVDIVDEERILMSPTATVSRLYIEKIGPGETNEVTFHMKADTHMQKGKSYEEIVILEFRDSYGDWYYWDSGPEYTKDMAYSLTIHTADNDKWPPTSLEEVEEKAQQELRQNQMILGAIIVLLIVFLIILMALYSRRRKAAMGDEMMEEEEYRPPAEEEEEAEAEEEEEEEEEPGPALDEEEGEEAGGEEEEEDWGGPEEEEKAEEEEEEDWSSGDEDEKEAPEEEEEEDWSSSSSEEEEEEDWSSDKET